MLVYGVRLPDGRRVPGLLDIEGMEYAAACDVAADLQRPDEQYRGRYAGWVTMAEQMLAGSTMIRPNWLYIISCLSSFDISDTARIERILAFVQSQMGKPYRYGADGPDAYDRPGSSGRSQQRGVRRGHYPVINMHWGPMLPARVQIARQSASCCVTTWRSVVWGRDEANTKRSAGNGMSMLLHTLAMSLSFNLSTGTTTGATRPFCGKPISGGS